MHWEGTPDSEEEEDELEYSDVEECVSEGEEGIKPFMVGDMSNRG